MDQRRQPRRGSVADHRSVRIRLWPNPAALWNDVLVGIVVAVLAVARLARPLMNPSLSWTNALFGLWLVVAPFVLGYGVAVEAEALATAGAVGGAQAAMWNDIIVGVIVLVLGAWSALSARGAGRLST
jgi:SPW repeat